jgi:hypothetical protein
MSNRTSQALADAWLNADLALTKKKRQEEMHEKEIAYKEKTAEIAAAQAELVSDRTDAATMGGNIAAGLSLFASYMGGGFDKLFSQESLLHVARAAGLMKVGAQVGEAVYDTGVMSPGLARLKNEIKDLKADIQGFDWMLSEQARKYDSGAADEFTAAGEYQARTDIAAYDQWADNYWQDPWEHVADIGSTGLEWYIADVGLNKAAKG